jgi:hypothetical protein
MSKHTEQWQDDGTGRDLRVNVGHDHESDTCGPLCPSQHLGVKLDRSAVYQVELTYPSERLGGRIFDVTWTGEVVGGEPQFQTVAGEFCQLPRMIVKSFLPLSEVQS